MVCPLCGDKRARRSCPALGHEICATCCGTKRGTEIRCTPDCGYLASARAHPAAVVARQQQRDLTIVAELLRDFSQPQSQLFLLVTMCLLRYEAPELHPLVDEDVSEAATALAATFETSVRGVIYEHRAASVPAARLIAALRPVLDEAGSRGGTRFERDAAVVLRRIVDAVRLSHDRDPGNRRAFLDLLVRANRGNVEERQQVQEPPRLIVP